MTRQRKQRRQLGDAITAFADSVLHGAGKLPNIGLGPIVWSIDPGSDLRHWYFMVASRSAQGELRIGRFKIAQDDRDLAERMRAALWLALLIRRPPIVLYDFDDELDLARWGEALAPGERSTAIRRGIEQERAALPPMRIPAPRELLQ